MLLLTSTFMDYLVKYVSEAIEDQCTFRPWICADFSDMKSILTIANSICSIKDIFPDSIHCCKTLLYLLSYAYCCCPLADSKVSFFIYDFN